MVLLRSSHFRCFLLLRHFVLKFVSPRYNGISRVTLKCIAKARKFLCGLPHVEFWCSAELWPLFSQFSDYLSSFFLRREFDGAGRALFFAACAEHYTIIGIFYDRSLFSLILFKLVRAECAVVYAFSAADAFFIINCRMPRYLASRNTMICFFRHFSSPLGCPV
jgi:hypothetical protein